MTQLNPNVSQSQPAVDVELEDVLNLNNQNLLIAFNCHHIGTIQSFNASNQTATAMINYQKTFFERDSETGIYNSVLKPYPPVVSCPVIVLGGGAASLTFPISAGDECLILFNDRNMDNWFQSNIGAGVASSRLHSFADAIVLVGIRSLANVLKNYDTNRAVLKNGNAEVGVGPELVKIANDLTSLKTIFGNLIAAIEGATYGGNSIDSTVALEAVKTLMGSLLE